MTEDETIRNENGFSMIELIIVVVVIAIIAMIALPNLLRARTTANEASAVSSTSLIFRSLMTYKTSIGDGEFTDLSTLYNGNFIDSTLGTAPNTKSGYGFELDVFPSAPGIEARFDLRARPAIHTLTSSLTGTGSKDFGITEAGGLHETLDNTAVTFDPVTRLPQGSAVPFDR